MAGRQKRIEELYEHLESWDQVVTHKCPRCGVRRRIAVKNDILGFRFRWQCTPCRLRIQKKNLKQLRRAVEEKRDGSR